MTPDEMTIKEGADSYARQNKKRIAKELTNTSLYPPEVNPVSVFMAGSPGAGKTESSKWLIIQLTGKENSIIRIDPDELRKYFEGYTGKNSNLFQNATTILAEKVHDLAIDNKQSFIFDTTFSKLDKARENIKRSINHKRPVQILYVYQDPLQAWNFVKQRELKDGRNVPKDAFIQEYFDARKTVNAIKSEFPQVEIYLLIKNIDKSNNEYYQNVDIDNYIKENYTADSLEKLLL